MRAASIIALSMWLTSCGAPPAGPEQQLRQWIAVAEIAAEEKDRQALVSMISEHYGDARGNDRAAIDGMLRYIFLRQHTVAVASKIDEVRVSDGTAAQVMLTVGMTGADDSLLGLSADAYRFHLELELDGDDWLLIGARWGELGQQLR